MRSRQLNHRLSTFGILLLVAGSTGCSGRKDDGGQPPWQGDDLDRIEVTSELPPVFVEEAGRTLKHQFKRLYSKYQFR